MKNKKMFTKVIIVFLVASMLTGCLKEAQQHEQTTNDNFDVELLFEKDGCKVYRFEDGGHSIYWTDCRGKVETEYSEQVGKSRRTVRVQNETVTGN